MTNPHHIESLIIKSVSLFTLSVSNLNKRGGLRENDNQHKIFQSMMNPHHIETLTMIWHESK